MKFTDEELKNHHLDIRVRIKPPATNPYDCFIINTLEGISVDGSRNVDTSILEVNVRWTNGLSEGWDSFYFVAETMCLDVIEPHITTEIPVLKGLYEELLERPNLKLEEFIVLILKKHFLGGGYISSAKDDPATTSVYFSEADLKGNNIEVLFFLREMDSKNSYECFKITMQEMFGENMEIRINPMCLEVYAHWETFKWQGYDLFFFNADTLRYDQEMGRGLFSDIWLLHALYDSLTMMAEPHLHDFMDHLMRKYFLSDICYAMIPEEKRIYNSPSSIKE